MSPFVLLDSVESSKFAHFGEVSARRGVSVYSCLARCDYFPGCLRFCICLAAAVSVAVIKLDFGSVCARLRVVV